MAFMGVLVLSGIMMLFLGAMALFFLLGLIFLVCGLAMKKKGLTVAGGVFAGLFLLMVLFLLILAIVF